MHIGVISDTHFQTDPRIRNEVRYLSQQSFQISVLDISHEKTNPVTEVDDIRIFHVRKSVRWQNIFKGLQNILPIYEKFWSQKIKEFVKKTKPDVIHVHDLYMAKAANLGVKGTNIPIVLDLHENFPAAIQTYSWANKFPKRILAKPKKWIKKERQYLGLADKLVVLSEHYKQVLCQRYDIINPDDVYVYPNVPDMDELLSYPVQEIKIGNKGDLILFYYGAIAHRRGIHTVLEALRRLISMGEKFHLLLIGPMDRADRSMYEEFFNDPILQGHITYYPWKDIREFPSFIMASDIGLSPLLKNDQHESGIANKVYQYMLFGRPVLVSNCRPQQDLIEEHQCGWVFESENVDDLVKVLRSIPGCNNLREMGINGRKVVKAKENLENKGKVLKSIYDDLSQQL